MQATGWSRRRASVAATGLVLLAGLPSALSYSAVELSLFGTPFLDVLDSSVGAFALPLGALAIVAVFGWAQDRVTLQAQVGQRLVRTLVRYVVPTVLVAVTGYSLLGRVGTWRWRRLPDVAGPGWLEAVATTGAVLALLAIVGGGIYRLRRGRRSRHRDPDPDSA
jgi:NSS family neurotransmitter:Na+ symporter